MEDVVLPIQLPRLKQYYRARAKLAAKAKFARNLSDRISLVDVTFMEGMPARAAAISRKGELTERVLSSMACGASSGTPRTLMA